MGTIYVNGSTFGYPSLADVLRSTGLPVQLWPGWEWNTRSSGGFAKLLGIVAHHTASNTSFQNDWNYCAQGHPDSPVANILLGRNGEIGLHSGGASNHAGQGGPWSSSKGIVPIDSGNSNLIGIEACNTGTGEPWPAKQLEVYERICAAICEAYELQPETDIPSHALVGPGWTNRKIDPYGPAESGVFQYTGMHTWDMYYFKARVRSRMNDVPIPPGDDDLPKPYLVQVVPAGTVYICDGSYVTYRWVTNGDSLARIQADMNAKGFDSRLNPIQPEQLTDQGILVGPSPG